MFSIVYRHRLALVLLGCMGAISLMASSAQAADPPTPYNKAKKTKAAPVSKTPSPNHGISFNLKLNEAVQDGKDAAMTIIVKNSGSQAVKYASIATVWSFDGIIDNGYYGVLSDLKAVKTTSSNSNTTDVKFVDLDKRWVNAGTIQAGKSCQLDGKIEVADREKFGIAGKNATFFCIQVLLRASYPTKPNATWIEKSAPVCRQYSVNQ